MPLIDNLRLLAEWSPMIGLLTATQRAATPKDKAVAVTEVLRFLAMKTPMELDDKVVLLVQQIVLTQQGEALVDYLAELVRGVLAMEQRQYEMGYTGLPSPVDGG